MKLPKVEQPGRIEQGQPLTTCRHCPRALVVWRTWVLCTYCDLCEEDK